MSTGYLGSWCGNRLGGDGVYLYEALVPGAHSQDCDDCGKEMEGTPIAKVLVREHGTGDVLPGESTDWLHLDCAKQVAKDMVQPAPPARVDRPWREGTQRDMVDFIQLHSMSIVETNFDHDRLRDKRYHFRLKEFQ